MVHSNHLPPALRHDAAFNSNERPRNNSGWRMAQSPHTNSWTDDEKGYLQPAWRNALDEIRRQVSRVWPSAPDRRSHRPYLSATRSSFAAPPISPMSQAVTGNVRFVLLCGLWYTTSALSSNTGKAILNQFKYPVTLTFIQFGFVAVYCILFMSPVIRFSKMKSPNKAIVRSTLPMGLFQVGGHIFSSMAISRIPVSTVHTIKALSPLFTVTAYALLFGVSYSARTYISLLPLTIGVMLACSFDMSASDAIGLLCAFGSALVFVSSNIFFKKIMPSNSGGGLSQTSHKLDKLNLLFYSSSMAFLLMVPIWLYSDLPALLASRGSPSIATPSGHGSPHSVQYYLFMNGTVHFMQNIIAFIILSSTSPVTYSIASLIKRVVVICIAIVWFKQAIHPVQAFGIATTFVGLYMYNAAKSDVEKGENKVRMIEAARDMILPTTKGDARILNGAESPPPMFSAQPPMAESTSMGKVGTAYGRTRVPSVSSTTSLYHAPPHSHVHPSYPTSTTSTTQPTLSIKTTHPPTLNITKASPVGDSRLPTIVSPVDSYPSPPHSFDSPPSNIVPLGLGNGNDTSEMR